MKFRIAAASASLLVLCLGFAGARADGYSAAPSAPSDGAIHKSGDVEYDCPAAGCEYHSNKPGTCPTHKKALALMALNFTCPKDGKDVGTSGKCPRCAMDAVQHKMATATSATGKVPRHAKVKTHSKAEASAKAS